ncbi:MAG: hypothetical protein JW781_01120 [Deltaproteobacteria bacterium]|nr:hypothetical protein [Candidatus Anaeroferrophillacea bacterium]
MKQPQSGKKFRRRLLVRRPFQLGVALRIAALQIPAVLVTALGLSVFYLFRLDRRTTADFDTSLLTWLAVLCVLITAWATWYSLRYTLGIAGPIHKTGRILRDIAAGRLPEQRITFRQGDQFKDLADDLNLLVASLRREPVEPWFPAANDAPAAGHRTPHDRPDPTASEAADTVSGAQPTGKPAGKPAATTTVKPQPAGKPAGKPGAGMSPEPCSAASSPTRFTIIGDAS